ncbi:hypothetical protein J7E38_06020 [Bacillus sp. ISL-35]|uniref:hypothetical protein n=1 Tax=Bacillus sp. ISL-35 TaxID=2819122 RepID=UPI001BEB3909|nr:hypothetical protein [Bacillus sp. ISL-35]MBT2678551.1 hypothetical protein [Bacillus sp. ISL-35]MBT2705856.1 hypothetical protein [Chryseobacterium sp. ISL-80]
MALIKNMMDKIEMKMSKLSIIKAMMNRNPVDSEKSVRHRDYDGQKSKQKRKNCPSSRL